MDQLHDRKNGRACPTDLCVTQLCARGAGASEFDCQKKWKQRLPCHCHHHRERTFPGDSRSAGRFSSTSPKPPPFVRSFVRFWRFDFETAIFLLVRHLTEISGRRRDSLQCHWRPSRPPHSCPPATRPAGRGQGLIPKTTMASEHDLL